MKYLLVIAVVGLVLWLMSARGRRVDAPPPAPRRLAAPQPMLRCARCGVHLPADEAVTDRAGRAFCSDAHRLAGPR